MSDYHTDQIDGQMLAHRQQHGQSNYNQFVTGNVSNEDIVKKIIDYIHDENKIQFGLLGSLFGTEKNASKNITFCILLIILIVIIILIFWVEESQMESQNFILSLWDKLLPIFTLAFGYFFGKQ